MRAAYFLSIGASLMLSSTAFAQHRGGGGHAGGGAHAGGAHAGGAHVGGVPHTGGYHPGTTYHSGGAYRGGYYGNNYGYRGGYYGGLGFGLGYGYGGLGLGYGGYGYGLGGYGYGLGGYGYGGYRYGGGYYSSPTVVVPQTYVVPSTTVVPAAPVTSLASPTETASPTGETALRITDLKSEGTARAAGLRRGDVILAVDGKRVQTFDDLRGVLSAAGKEVKVEFVDGSNGQIDQKTVKVEGTKIGVTVDEVPLTRS